jgi:hypothetical protein
MFNISIPAISIAINGERRKEFNLQKSLAGPYDNLHNSATRLKHKLGG